MQKHYFPALLFIGTCAIAACGTQATESVEWASEKGDTSSPERFAGYAACMAGCEQVKDHGASDLYCDQRDNCLDSCKVPPDMSCIDDCLDQYPIPETGRCDQSASLNLYERCIETCPNRDEPIQVEGMDRCCTNEGGNGLWRDCTLRLGQFDAGIYSCYCIEGYDEDDKYVYRAGTKYTVKSHGKPCSAGEAEAWNSSGM